MADRKSFLLRVDRDTLDAVQQWANDDLRSLNAQIEFLLRRALQANGRAHRDSRTAKAEPSGSDAVVHPSINDVVDDAVIDGE